MGKNTTFNPTNKLPIIGSRIWTTLADLEAYLNDPTSSAIAGIQVAVVADTTAANNGTYEIIFDNPALLVTGEEYIGIKDGKAMTPTVSFATEAAAQAAVTGGTIDSYRPNIAITYDDSGVTKSNLTYRKLITTGEVGTDTYVANGTLRVDTTENKTYIDLRYNTDPSAAIAPVQIEVTDLVPPDSVVTYSEGTLNATRGLFNNDAVQVIQGYIDSKTTDTVVTYDPQEGAINATTGVFNDTAMGVIKNYIDDQIPQQPDDTVVTYNTVEGTLNATQGLFNDTAVNVIKDYIDDFDCGSFDLNP